MSGENESKTQTTDVVRKEVGKKDPDLMEKVKEEFTQESEPELAPPVEVAEQPPEKSPLELKREHVSRLLERYPAKLGLGVLRPSNEVERFLTMTTMEIRRMSAEECGEAAVILNQSGTYIQLELNRVRSDLDWCNKYIDWLVAKTIAQYGGKYTPFEYRRLLASRDNDVAMKLHKIVSDAELQAKCIEYLPNQLRATAKSFSDLQQTKRSQRI